MPNVSASISVPFAPERPEIAKLEAASGVATVRVDIDAQGNLMHSSVVKSSGNHWLDEAALTSAQLTRYAAERDNCESVGGSYALLVEFDD
jgi:TonB family protein